MLGKSGERPARTRHCNPDETAKPLVPAISELLDKLIPDPDVRERAKLELAKEENNLLLQQLQFDRLQGHQEPA